MYSVLELLDTHRQTRNAQIVIEPIIKLENPFAIPESEDIAAIQRKGKKSLLPL